jgi:membrane-associated progesterone receptor component
MAEQGANNEAFQEYLKNGNPQLDLSKLGSEYKVGPMTFKDVIRIGWNSLREYYSKQFHEIELFLEELRQGKTSAIIVTAVAGFLGVMMAYFLISRFILYRPVFPKKKKSSKSGEEEERPKAVEPIVLRDFTIDQLASYNGTNNQPIYVAMCDDVFDVSDAENFYGPGGSYHCFAGRNSTRAMAKFCFDEVELANPETSDLGPFERMMLQDWYNKFKFYKGYPIVGKLSYPPKDLKLTVNELTSYTGENETGAVIPKDRVDAPIYVAINDKIYDVSYGGKEMYGMGGPYHKFAGKNCTRALAKMSLDQSDIDNDSIAELTEEQKKTLKDWEDKFLSKKKYPVVGTLIKEESQ